MTQHPIIKLTIFRTIIRYQDDDFPPLFKSNEKSIFLSSKFKWTDCYKILWMARPLCCVGTRKNFYLNVFSFFRQILHHDGKILWFTEKKNTREFILCVTNLLGQWMPRTARGWQPLPKNVRMLVTHEPFHFIQLLLHFCEMYTTFLKRSYVEISYQLNEGDCGSSVYAVISSDGSLPVRCQVIIWMNAGLLVIRPPVRNIE